jgi:hypothetical protein
METCHYCFDTVNKLNDEYDILYKQLEIADNIIKKNNYKYCLSLIPKTKKRLKEIYDDEDLFDNPEERKDFEFNSKNFLRFIEEITREDEFEMLIEFLNDD